MLFEFFKRFKNPAISMQAHGSVDAEVAIHETISYPPVDQGIPIESSERILSTQENLLDRLRVSGGGTDGHFDRYYLTPVQNLANYIQLLPASSSDTHAGAGGLFRLALEMGVFSLQSSERMVFAEHESVEDRRELEPRWRYAAFLAGLCSELYRIVSHMIITDVNGSIWPKHIKSITDWVSENQIDRYYIQWQPESKTSWQANIANQSVRSDVALIIKSIIPDYCMQYLEDGSTSIIPVVFAVAAHAMHPSESPIAKLVIDVRTRVLHIDKATRSDRYGKLQIGSHLETHILDAMRVLYRNGTWKINESKSRIWYGEDGFFIIWKSAAKEIVQNLRENGHAGVPQDIETLAGIMLEARVIEPNGKMPVWTIKTPESDTVWQAVKIADPATILGEDVVEPSSALLNVGKTVIPVEENTEKQVPPPTDTKAKATPQPENVIPFRRDSTTQIKLAVDNEKNIPEKSQLDRENQQALESFRLQPSEPPAQMKKPQNNSPTPQSDTDKKQKKTRKAKDPDLQTTPEINPAAAEESFVSVVNKSAREVTPRDLLEVLGRMITDFRQGTSHSIFPTQLGVAIRLNDIQSYGVTRDRLLTFLDRHNFISAPPEYPDKKVNKVLDPSGKEVNCCVITNKAAEHFGFIA